MADWLPGVWLNGVWLNKMRWPMVNLQPLTIDRYCRAFFQAVACHCSQLARKHACQTWAALISQLVAIVDSPPTACQCVLRCADPWLVTVSQSAHNHSQASLADTQHLQASVSVHTPWQSRCTRCEAELGLVATASCCLAMSLQWQSLWRVADTQQLLTCALQRVLQWQTMGTLATGPTIECHCKQSMRQ